MENPTISARDDPRAVTWFREWILAFRKRHASFDSKYRKYLQRYTNFAPPTQVAHLWVRSPEIVDFHLVLVTHATNPSDLSVRSWGPLSFKQVNAAVEEFDLNPVLEEPIVEKRRPEFWRVRRPDTPETVRFQLDSHLAAFLSNLRSYAFMDHHEEPNLHPNALGENASIWSFHGDMFALDPTGAHDEQFRTAEQNYHAVREFRRARRKDPVPAHAPARDDRVTGYYAFLYPRMTIGKRPKLPVHERLWGGWSFGPGRIVIRHSKDGIDFFATRNGAIGVVVADKSQATDLLNGVVAEIAGARKDSRFLRTKDVASFEKRNDAKPGDLEFSSYAWPEGYSPGREREDDWLLDSARWVPEKMLLRALERAVTRRNDPGTQNRLRLLEAETHLREGQPRQAFFMAWLVVETQLTLFWETFLQNISPHRAKPTKEATGWRVVQIAGALSMAEAIPRSLASRIIAFNARRNRIVHEGLEPTNNEVSQLIATVSQLLVEIKSHRNSNKQRRWLRRRNPLRL